MCTPPGVKGINGTRHWIWKWCKDNSINKFIMLDDDLAFSKRNSNEDWKHATVIPPEDTVKMFNLLYDMLEDYPHASISEKLGNNRHPGNVKENTRYVRVLAYNLKLIPINLLKFNRIEVMEDYDIALQLLRLGKKCGVLFRYCQEQSGSNAKGGCSTYRTLEVQNRSAQQLAKFHPEFVTVVKKTTKGSWFTKDGINERLDVRIQWKKAYESSQS